MAYLPLQQIKIDGGTQSRVELNESVVADYAEVIRRGDSLPPVVVFFDGSTHWLADGFHRFHAHRTARAEEIEADVRTGARRDAVLFSVGANAHHGLRRTNEDKRRAVQTLLDDAEWSQWSDRQIAEACGVSHPFVAAVRNPEVVQRQQENRRAAASRQVESDSTPAPARPGVVAGAGCNPITPPAPAAAVESVSSEAPAPAAGPQVEPDSTPATPPVPDGAAEQVEEGDGLDDEVPSLESLLDDAMVENRRLRFLLEAAEADDQVAETLKWRRGYESAKGEKEIAERRVRDAELREKKSMNWLRRCGRAVGEEDPRHIPAKVERVVKAAKDAGAWTE